MAARAGKLFASSARQTEERRHAATAHEMLRGARRAKLACFGHGVCFDGPD